MVFAKYSQALCQARRFQRDSLQLPKYGRYYHSHVVYRNKLYLLGGFSMKGPTNEAKGILHLTLVFTLKRKVCFIYS